MDCMTGDYLDGSVFTPDGIVHAYAQGSGSSIFPHTKLDFVWKNTVYSKSFNKRYSKRGIAMLARKFAKEIVGSKLKIK